MFLDLASTVTGGALVLVGEGIALGLFMLWALMSTGKKADEQMEEYSKKCRPEDCEKWENCEFRKIAPIHEWEA